MKRSPIHLKIESLKHINPKELWASFFVNPTIALMESYKLSPFPFEVTCESIVSPLVDEESEVHITIGWDSETFPDSQRILRTVQRPVIVEYAAVAVAFLLVTKITDCKIDEVTLRGDKADYFLCDRKLMLEVSGTEISSQLSVRLRRKSEQLQANPYGKGGYVVVCCFSNQKMCLSFLNAGK